MKYLQSLVIYCLFIVLNSNRNAMQNVRPITSMDITFKNDKRYNNKSIKQFIKPNILLFLYYLINQKTPALKHIFPSNSQSTLQIYNYLLISILVF